MRNAYALFALPLLALPGCRMNERMTGTAGGAVGGTVIGVVAGASAGTVLILAGAGALTGYLVGDYMADQRERCSPCQPSAGAESPCAVPASTSASTLPAPTASRGSGTVWDARVAYEKGRSAPTVEDARAAYQESARLDPSRPEPWNALALLSVAQGDRTAARAHLTKALSLDPSYGPAQHNLDRLDRGL
jgi:tetratricopeptide (TPR) repeat protein